MHGSGDELRKRLFFALRPDAKIRTALARIAAASLDDRVKCVSADNLHLTLVFLGSTSAADESAAIEAADTVSGSSFDLQLSRLGCFPKSRVAWSAPTETPMELEYLVARLRSALSVSGLPVERRSFRPHITLARRVKSVVAEKHHRPVVWSASEFCLVHSRREAGGTRYAPIRFWSLQSTSST